MVDSFRLTPTALAAVTNSCAALTSTAVSAMARMRKSSGAPALETSDAVGVALGVTSLVEQCVGLVGVVVEHVRPVPG